MAQSINTRVDVVVEATSYQGLTNYGKIMVGDKGFEFFNTRNVNDYIQIPWGEVDYVIDSTLRDSDKEKWNLFFCVQRTKESVACDQPIYTIRASCTFFKLL